MDDKKSELLQYAREYAAANKDLYELLAVSTNAAQPEVHRAWRKASLKHHPDKARAFDPEVWQLFERARDVLSSPEARAAYDSARAAALQTRKARDALDARKRAMIDDLEARERGVKRKVGEGDDGGDANGARMMTASEKRVLMERGREYVERRRRMREEAEARDRERERERERTEGNNKNGENITRKETEPLSTQPGSARPPATTTTTTGAASTTTTSTATGTEGADAHPPTDEYDERIADLERRMRERKAEKAARKAEKKSKPRKEKDDVHAADEDGGKSTDAPPVAAAAPPPHITTTTTTTTSRTSASNAALGDFSSTMAKLRAAQREKERKRAEAAAAAAAAVSTATMASDG
ncbi:hypothetical protein F5X97DRAFT_650 [Nemania serpens]|nr:hypothetical protein F5X97DRAFT_650 [Nemania serpens]